MKRKLKGKKINIGTFCLYELPWRTEVDLLILK